jgi:hypothetical protein
LGRISPLPDALEPIRHTHEDVGASPNEESPRLEGLPLGIGDAVQPGRTESQHLGSEVLNQAVAEVVGNGAAPGR